MGKGEAGRRSLQRKQMPDKHVGLEQSLQTSLQGISKKASRNKKARFENLYQLLTVRNLNDCFYKLRKKSASGVDKVTWFDYEENLQSNLENLVVRLKNKSYRARLVKRVYIPKLNGKLRPLGIPSLEDKIVQSCVAKILESIYEEVFLTCSYGYRPNLCALAAVKDLTQELQFGKYSWIVEADIKGFFDNIDHDWMIEMLELKIKDRALLNLIKKWLKAGILETDGKILDPITGTPQGGIVSPILSNIYLHYALDFWFQKKIKGRCKGRAFLLRYADDFVAGFQYSNEAQEYYSDLEKRLVKFNLNTEPSKTQKIPFSRFKPDDGEHFEFLGFSFHWRTDRSGKSRVIKTTMKKKFQASLANFKEWIKKNRHCKLAFIMKTLKSKLRGHWNYYGLHGNFPMIKAFWNESLMLLWKWLNRRSQRKSYTLKGLVEMLNHFDIPRPKITEQPATKRKVFLWM